MGDVFDPGPDEPQLRGGQQTAQKPSAPGQPAAAGGGGSVVFFSNQFKPVEEQNKMRDSMPVVSDILSPAAAAGELIVRRR